MALPQHDHKTAGTWTCRTFKTREVPCPLCGATDFQAFLIIGDTVFGFPGEFRVVRCRPCGMLFTNPQLIPEDLPRFYPASYSAHDPKELTRPSETRGRRNLWDILPPVRGGRLLDVGCGNGKYLLRQRARGWAVLGVEPSEAAVRIARNHGLDVLQGVIPGVPLPAEPFHTITLLGVLDHIPLPINTLQELARHLHPDGRIIVSVPNAASLACRLFGPDWPGWDLPRHQNHFTPATLTAALRQAGLKVIRLSGRRRSSRWQQAAVARLRRRHGRLTRWLATSRTASRLAAGFALTTMLSDELVVIAGHDR